LFGGGTAERVERLGDGIAQTSDWVVRELLGSWSQVMLEYVERIPSVCQGRTEEEELLELRQVAKLVTFDVRRAKVWERSLVEES